MPFPGRCPNATEGGAVATEDAVPKALRNLHQWVVWRFETRDGKPAKVPVNIHTGRHASVTDSATWGDYDEVVTYHDEHPDTSGVGFVFTDDDPFVGIDLDKCRDPDTGVIEPRAQRIIERLASYTELSPSGTGVHIFVSGSMPGDRRRRGNVEMYEASRFFCVTGLHVEGTPFTIESRQAEINAIYAEVFGESHGEAGSAETDAGSGALRSDSLDDDELLEKARAAGNGEKFERLFYQGDTSGHDHDDSKADSALCCMLAFWSKCDPDQIDRLFRRSKLYRAKWDEKHFGDGRTYGEGTIDAAIKFVRANNRPIEKFTDLGNAVRFVRLHGDIARYVHTWKKWLIWDGRHWAKDMSGGVIRLAKQVPAEIYREAASVAASQTSLSQTLAGHAKSTQSRRRLADLVSLAESELPVTPNKLDRNPWLLNVANGTIDLRTGDLRPHNQDDLITRVIEVVYNENATCPYWMESLDTIFEGNRELIAFVKRAVGYSLTGIVDERCFFILWGDGWNGKSLFVETIAKVFGPYGTNTPVDTVVRRRDEGPSNDLAALRGMRFVFASEAPENSRFAEARIKAMTGGDTVSARFLYGEFFTFQPEFTMWLATNHKPQIQGHDQAIWDRIRLIPFTHRFRDDQNQMSRREVVARYDREMSGILRWFVEGCLEWRRDGLDDAQAVKDATANYRDEMNVVKTFIGETCTTAEGAVVSSEDLYTAYVEWSKAGGEKSLTRREFGLRMTAMGFKSGAHTASRRVHWFGVGLVGRAARE